MKEKDGFTADVRRGLEGLPEADIQAILRTYAAIRRSAKRARGKPARRGRKGRQTRYGEEKDG